MEYSRNIGCYQQVGVETEVAVADPHKLVSMLLNGAIERYQQAKYFIGDGDMSQKIEVLDKALAIIDSLNASLNHEQGGELADNLGGLYEYVMNQTVLINSKNDIELLDEVVQLLITVRDGWDGIRHQVEKKPNRGKGVGSHAGINGSEHRFSA